MKKKKIISIGENAVTSFRTGIASYDVLLFDASFQAAVTRPIVD